MRAALLFASLLLATTLLPTPAAAVVPTAEVNDLLWCVDQTSTTLRNVVHAYASAIAQTYDANYRNLKCKLHQRPPIHLASDPTTTDPATLQALYGIVRGTGTASNPYVIENWEIAGSDTFTVHAAGLQQTTPSAPEYVAYYGQGIYFGNVQKHYVVNKVYVHGFNCVIHDLISPAGLSNGAACASHPRDGPSGIRIVGDHGDLRITVQNSLLVDNTNGVKVTAYDGSVRGPQGTIRIAGNEIHADWLGVYVDHHHPFGIQQRVDVIGNRIFGVPGPNTPSNSGSTTAGIYFAPGSGIVTYEVSQNVVKGQTSAVALYTGRPYGHSNRVCGQYPWLQLHDQPVGWWWEC